MNNIVKGYTDEPISKILNNIGNSDVTYLDRWLLKVDPNTDCIEEKKGKDNLPLNVVNNYFSLGVDAHIALEFHQARGMSSNNPFAILPSFIWLFPQFQPTLSIISRFGLKRCRAFQCTTEWIETNLEYFFRSYYIYINNKYIWRL